MSSRSARRLPGPAGSVLEDSSVRSSLQDWLLILYDQCLRIWTEPNAVDVLTHSYAAHSFIRGTPLHSETAIFVETLRSLSPYWSTASQ